MPLRCLLVDDNDAFLETARVLLEREGIQVAGMASNIAGALRQVRALRPDIILVDIGLGEESGFELARLLAADGQDGKRVRADVILISARAETDYTDLIAESPAAGFLPKSALSAERISQILNRQLRAGQPGFQLAGIAIARLPGRRDQAGTSLRAEFPFPADRRRTRDQPSSMGSLISSVVPAPTGLATSIVPPSASTRSVRPMSPEPRAGSAPPRPSSRIESARTPSRASTATCTAEARACFAAFVSASDTM